LPRGGFTLLNVYPVECDSLFNWGDSLFNWGLSENV
jgi:hypothetical protein